MLIVMKRMQFRFLFFILFQFTYFSLLAQSPRLVLPIGHTASVNSTAFSSNGKYLITASDDQTCKLFECATGKEIYTLVGHKNAVVSAEFVNGQSKIITASKDSTIRLWDIQTGLETNSFHFDAPLSSLIIHPNGREFASLTSNGTIDLLSLESGILVRNIKSDFSEVSEIVFSPNGLYLTTATCDSTIQLYNTLTGEIEKLFQGHSNCVSSVRFSPDGKLLLSTSSDNTARLWDIESGRTIWICNEFTDYLFSGEFNSIGNKVVLAGANNFAVVCDLLNGYKTNILSGHSEVLLSACFSKDDKHILTSSEDNSVITWNSISGVVESKILYEDNLTSTAFIDGYKDSQSNTFASYGGISSVMASPNGKDFLMINKDLSMSLFEIKTGKRKANFKGTSLMSNSNIFLKNGNAVVSSFIDHSIVTWKVNEGKPTKRFATNGSGNVFVRMCDDESLLAASYNGDSIIIWDAITSKALNVIKDDFRIHKYDLSRNSKYVATVFLDNSIRIWNARTGNILRTIEAHENDIRACIFSPSSETIMSFDNGGPVRLWQVSSGELIREFNVAGEGVYQVVFNDTGSLLATVAYNGETSIWDVNSGEIISTFISDQQEIDFIEFTSNSELLLVSNMTKMIVLEIQSAKIIREFDFPNVTNYFAIQSPDSRLLFYANSEGSIYLYDLNSGALLHKMKGQAHQVYSASFSSNNKFVVFTGSDHKTILRDVESGKISYTRLQLENNDWLVYDEDYRFDGSPGAIEKLYFTCGLEIIELGQIKDALYVPGLAKKIVNGEDINYPKLSEIDICGALPIIEKTEENEGGWKFQLEQRRWPVVRIDVKVDGKTVKSIPSNQLQFENGIVEILLSLSEMQHFFVGGKENVISISAVTSQNGSEIKSRGIDVLFFAEEPKDPPRMFMLMIGVSDYKDDALDLVFPAHDARSLGNALELSANKLLGDGNVEMYHVQSKTKENAVFTTPEREGVMKALADIGSKAKANDVLFIFFAGHGVMQGQSDKSFTFLTADASQINQIGISTTDLTSWLSPEGPFKMLPNKTILVYDACNSGQAAKELIAALARNDDDTERLRQIEELGDKSGLFILSASAPNKPAYELPQLGQGLLTYSLLYTLKNNPNIIDQGQDGKGYLNLQKWFLESEREQNQRVLSLGLKQEAQPYGTGNIKLGVVDDEVRNAIHLMDEKPLVFCGNARDENDEDPLELKRSVNDYFENALVRGLPSSLAFVAAETPNANVIKLIYNIEENQVNCRVLFFKNKIKMKEITVNVSSENILSKIVETITSTLEN